MRVKKQLICAAATAIFDTGADAEFGCSDTITVSISLDGAPLLGAGDWADPRPERSTNGSPLRRAGDWTDPRPERSTDSAGLA